MKYSSLSGMFLNKQINQFSISQFSSGVSAYAIEISYCCFAVFKFYTSCLFLTIYLKF